MVFKYEGKEFITDNDLKVNILGFWPKRKIKNSELKKFFEKEFNRDFLGGDELVAYSQTLVSGGMDFNYLEGKILEDIKNPEKPYLKEIIFNKTATGIGRGHSLGGLSGVVLGINGTKMIDSGLTGLVSSRSLVTSSRRRETGEGDIAIPENLTKRKELLKEYMDISKEVLEMAKEFKEKFGKLGGIETFNKVIPYNNPADLFIVLPLDTLSTIVSEVRSDKLNSNENYLPKEIHSLANKFSELTKEAGQNIMFNQRTEVPRDTYLHYNVFKDPSLSNYALEKGEEFEMSLEPKISDYHKDFTKGFLKELEKLKNLFEDTAKIQNPKELAEKSMECIYAMRNFTGEYNESARVKISDSLSWRVWSEQKRHATLRQNNESVYSASHRATLHIKEFWPLIEKANQENNFEQINNILSELEKSIIIDDRLKKKKELLIPYIYHTARQLMFYDKLLNNGIEERDALYIVPRNIRLRTLENYDLVNLINLELPLRLCNTCEPERKATSWKKRDMIAGVFPELDYFLKSKCRIGYCTEGLYCGDITAMRKYNKELHKDTKEHIMDSAKKNVENL